MDYNTVLQDGLMSILKENVKTYPQHVNRISEMGHPCSRYLYYSRACWDKKQPPNHHLLGVFETGNILESKIQSIITAAGENSSPKFRIVGSQMVTNDALLKKYNISGSTDGILQVYYDKWQDEGTADIKTCHPNIFTAINSFEDLQKYSWTQKYPAQLMLYSFAFNLDKCFIIFVNKANLYDMKVIEFNVDYGYVESLLAKAERINDAIERAEPPVKINQVDTCSRCPFEHICCPDIKLGEGMDIIENAEIADLLDRRAELLEYHKEYEACDKKIKSYLNKGKDAICGKWLLTWKYFLKKEYTVPASEVFSLKIQSTQPEDSL